MRKIKNNMELRFDHIKIIITKTKKKIFRIAIATIIIIAVIIIALSGLVLTNKNKLVRGLKIADISVGGLEPGDANDASLQLVSLWLKKDVVLRYKTNNESEIWTALPEELGIEIGINSTIDRASRIGHQGKIFLDIGQQILAFLGYYNLSLDYEINETEFENFIGEKLNSLDDPAVNAGWQYNKNFNKFVQIPSQEGMIIDRENFKLQLNIKIEKLTKDDVFLTLINDYPEIVEDETIEAYNEAKEILENAPYSLTPPQTLLTKEELIPMIEFRAIKNKLEVTLNRQKLENYLIALSPLIDRDPVEAQFKIEGDQVTEFSLSQNGLKLDIEKSISKITRELLNLDKKDLPAEALAEAGINLEIIIIPPKTATKDIDNFGVTSLVGKGESNFGGSPNNRIHNIKTGASKFNGVLLKPGEEFSFNTILGEVGPEQGYKPELVIKQDKTIPEYGGGLCQVSTTAFRAAVYAGLPITERQPHAFPVVYYNPQGFDATIYPPHPDLRFINDTPGHILIQTKVEGNILTFEFYGTNDGRKVEVYGPHQYDTKTDGSMKAKLTRKILRNGELVEEKTWYSDYKSPSLYPVQRNPLE